MVKIISEIPYVDYSLLKNILKTKRRIISTKSRSTVILPSFIGTTIYVHNGRVHKKVVIREDMIGHKLGEFSFTRKMLSNIHVKKRKKLGSKKK